MPTQWIETDKREHMRRAGVKHIPDYKSRFVTCGQFENRHGIRSDSPTCNVEGLYIVCSYAACNNLRLKCSELRILMRSSMASLWTGLLLLAPPKRRTTWRRQWHAIRCREQPPDIRSWRRRSSFLQGISAACAATRFVGKQGDAILVCILQGWAYSGNHGCPCG